MTFQMTLTATVMGLWATTAAAQTTVVTSPCQPETSSVTAADMAQYLAGTWSMSAAGTGFTTGTNFGSVTLAADPETGQLTMSADGMSVPLVPMGLARELDEPAPDEPDFDMALEGLSGGGLTQSEIEVLTGCDRPMRYWWSMGSGNRRSWGGIMFVEPDMASGFMANSAGGSRSVIYRR
ncbi:hypothetical protein [Yoonia sp. 208BN28-4]|uniref:hypothetical protein n=1 Tax=Yoonia sp. 208BN28-4 TaxID=3126505 RepID=UPI0030A8B22A